MRKTSVEKPLTQTEGLHSFKMATPQGMTRFHGAEEMLVFRKRHCGKACLSGIYRVENVWIYLVRLMLYMYICLSPCL